MSKSRIIKKNVQTNSNDCIPPSVGAFADLQKEKKNLDLLPYAAVEYGCSSVDMYH